MPAYIILFGAVITSAWLTRLARDWSARRGLLDEPTSRSSHVHPTPRLGGLGIVPICLAAWILTAAAGGEPAARLLPLAAGALIAAAVGFADDLWSLPPWLKLAGQLAALVPLGALIDPRIAGWPVWAGMAVAAVGIVAYLNLFNFMDGSDGLAGGVAVVNGLALAALARATSDAWLPLAALGLAAVALGFLRYNYSPASVFMGDGGSHFFGYAYAALGLFVIQEGVSPIAVALALAPFVFDGSFTLARRLVRGERFWRAHRSHLYQRLLIVGRTHREVAHLYYGWAVLSALLAVGYEAAGSPLRAWILVAAAAAASTLVLAVWRLERRAAAAPIAARVTHG